MADKIIRKKRYRAVVSFLVFCLMLVALCSSKISLVWLMWLHSTENISSATWYISGTILMMTPTVFTLLHIFWSTSFIAVTHWTKWPRAPNLLLGLLSSVLEMGATAIFIFEVAPLLPPSSVLPLMNTVYIVPILYHIVKRYHTQSSTTYWHANSGDDLEKLKLKERKSRTIVKFCFGVGMLSLAGLGSYVLYWFAPQHLHLAQAILLPLVLFFLSVIWMPQIQTDAIKSSNGTFEGRWKSTGLYSSMKLLISPVIVYLILIYRYHDLRGPFVNQFLDNGFAELGRVEVLIPIIVNIGAGVLAMIMGYVSTTLGLATSGLLLPAMVSTPLSVGTLTVLCHFGFGIPVNVCFLGDGIPAWCFLGLSLVIWIFPFVLWGGNISKCSQVLLKPFHEMFIQLYWSNIYLEQHLLLNYNPDGFTNSRSTFSKEASLEKSKIFVCTTMFREADFEMQRYLMSLCRLSCSQKLRNIYIEAHIFLDNGSEDLKMTDSAQRLNSLLLETIGVDPNQGSAYRTPYGLQLRWMLPGGVPLFMHLKDSNKFKPKKRWSQVMYMNYILNYRCKVVRELEMLSKSSPEYRQNLAESVSSHFKNLGTFRTPDSPGRSSIYKHKDIEKELIQLAKLLQDRDKSNTKDWGTHAISLSVSKLLKALRSDDIRTTLQKCSNTSPDMESLSEDSATDDVTENSDAYTVSRESSEGNYDIFDSDTDLSAGSSAFVNFNGDFDRLTRMPFYRQGCRGKSESDHLYTRAGINNLGFIGNFGTQPHKPTTRKSRQTVLPSIHLTSKTQTSPSRTNLLDDWGDEDESLKFPSENSSGLYTIGVTDDYATVGDLNNASQQQYYDDHTYILATDADMEFDESSVRHVLNICNQSKKVGGACGRTHPIGQRARPIVWYQKFEYAKDFWMIKTAQNVIGCVMCCPGCFSLYRAAAVRDVMHSYSEPTTSAFDVFIKDNGEDRWMCTLMMLSGWKLEYTAYSDNSTYCPDTFLEFLKQRRRWVLSEMSNLLLVFKNLRLMSKKNPTFSIVYMAYILQMFMLVVLSPSFSIMMMTAALDIIFNVAFVVTTPIAFILLAAYVIVCCTKPIEVQAKMTLVATIFLGVIMLAISAGFMWYMITDTQEDLKDGHISFKQYYLIFVLLLAVIYASVIHISDAWNILYGGVFLLAFPAMYILIPFYAVSNIVDQSWGTRDEKSSKKSKEKEVEDTEAGKLSVIHSPETVPSLDSGPEEQKQEYQFWEDLRTKLLGRDVNLGTDGDVMRRELKRVRNGCIVTMMLANFFWLTFLSTMYMLLPRDSHVFGFVLCGIYSFSLVIQLIGMTVNKLRTIFRKFVVTTYGSRQPIWVPAKAKTKT